LDLPRAPKGFEEAQLLLFNPGTIEILLSDVVRTFRDED
jgi:hypothetical protein